MMLLVDIHYLFASFTHSGKGRAKVSKPHKTPKAPERIAILIEMLLRLH